MTNFIPIYPLEIVVYPGEELRLHIFEDRYKHLATDCYGENKPFGIVPVINNRIMEFGTTVQIVEVSDVWEDGRMNIIAQGKEIFQHLELVKEIPQKLYGGSIVSYPGNILEGSPNLKIQIVQSVKELLRLTFTEYHFEKPDEELTSYDIAHLAGLSLLQEYELLQLLYESQRLEYLRRHLLQALPIIAHINKMQKKLSQKMDFKNFKAFDL